MIISASYRTDIPAFYGRWFMNRLEAKYCKVKNPYGGQAYNVSLTKEMVSGFVFWTKNIAPFFDCLDFLNDNDFPFYVQYTVNNYPHTIEENVPPLARSICNIKKITARYGSSRIVWRYDPLVFSNMSNQSWHLDNFALIAGCLKDFVDEVIVSFLTFYKKTIRNIEIATRVHNLSVQDPDYDTRKNFLALLKEIANQNNITLKICCQPELTSTEVVSASCIDVLKLEKIAGRSINSRVKGNREGCYCFESRDIGGYDSCIQGCIYCYAVNNTKFALDNFSNHNPHSEFLII